MSTQNTGNLGASKTASVLQRTSAASYYLQKMQEMDKKAG